MEISEDGGSTWLSCFVPKQATRKSNRYELELYRYLATANLTITYEIGQGTYSTIEGNTTEDTEPQPSLPRAAALAP